MLVAIVFSGLSATSYLIPPFQGSRSAAEKSVCCDAIASGRQNEESFMHPTHRFSAVRALRSHVFPVYILAGLFGRASRSVSQNKYWRVRESFRRAMSNLPS